MVYFFKTCIVFCLFQFALFAKPVETFYSSLEVEEPVLLELIECPAMQRLKEIHQYGVAYYTTHQEEYTRYAHSLGVFAILRIKGASLEEQIAGLLHDVSHTVFSHVGDWIYGKEHLEKDYQNCTHETYLEQCGIGKILEKYHYTIEQVLPEQALFPMLEQPGPALCADRIEYNVQGAYHRGFITHEQALDLIASLDFIDGDWVCTNTDLMTKVALFSLHMTHNCWGSAENHLTASWLASALIKAVDLGYITFHDIHFGNDHEVWTTLNQIDDYEIKTWLYQVIHADHHYTLVDPTDADLIVHSKFRGIDPWIIFEGTKMRLTSFDPIYNDAYHALKTQLANGWSIKIQTHTSRQTLDNSRAIE